MQNCGYRGTTEGDPQMWRNQVSRGQAISSMWILVRRACPTNPSVVQGSPYIKNTLWFKNLFREFPGGPVVRTPCSQHWEPGFNPFLGKWDPTSHTAQSETFFTLSGYVGKPGQTYTEMLTVLIFEWRGSSSKREPSYTIDRNVNWCSHYEKQYEVSSKN